MSDAIERRGQERLSIVDRGLPERFALVVRSPITHDHYMEPTEKQPLVVCSWNLDQNAVDQSPKVGVSSRKTDTTSQSQDLMDALVLRMNRSDLVVKRAGHSMNPMYYQWSQGQIAFSTERKALWSIGLSNGMELEPGQTLHVDEHHPRPVITTQQRPYPHVDMSRSREDLLASLQRRLEESFRCVRSAENVGVLFSGGVDSSLAALLGRRTCRKVSLFSACAKGSHDQDAASRAAQALEMELEIVPFDTDTVWETLPELVYAIETTRLADVEIALPFFIAARAAHRSGNTILISGQGTDELFGGYAKHAALFLEKGEDALDAQLRSEVEETHKVNIERDEKAIGYNGLSAFFPYLNSQFVFEALAVPSRWKISNDSPPERKAIFRELAVNMGLPDSIALNPKKATQYSSGSQRVISKAISEKVRPPPDIEKKGKVALVQAVLNRIAKEVDIPVESVSNSEMEIELKPAREFVRKIRKSNHRQ